MNQPPPGAHRPDSAAPLDDAAQQAADLRAVLEATEQALASSISPQIDVESSLAAVRRRGGPPAAVTSPEQNDARELFAALRALPARSPQRAELRDRLVGMHLPLIEDLAGRFRDRGESLEVLTRVATTGLITALDRYDSDQDMEFSAWATRTVLGELTRHLQDQAPPAPAPHPRPELCQTLTEAVIELTASSGRAPTVREIAAYLQIPVDEVLEGLNPGNASSARSLSRPAPGGQDPDTPARTGLEETPLSVEHRQALTSLLQQLPPREKQIAILRLLENMTTAQIAREIGISETHVTRILTRTTARLHDQLLIDE